MIHKYPEEILTWWNWLDFHRGDRARLRECKTHKQAYFTNGFSQLRHKINDPEANLYRLAFVAGILAHIKTHTNASLISNSKEKLSNNKFLLLMKLEINEADYTHFIAQMGFAKYKANVVKLATDLYYWSDSVKERWALEFFK